MSSPSLPAFGPTCPLGGTWYACQNGTFFTGCCTRDPCQVTCAQGDLLPAGFNPAYHSKFPDASCGSGVSYWTCTSGNTFMGCCKTNPCSNNSTCANGDLEPAFVNREDLRSAYGVAVGTSSVSSLQQASTISTTASSTMTVSTATRNAAAATDTPKNGPPVAAIAGVAAGGALALVAVVGLLIYCFCHTKKSQKGHEESSVSPQSHFPSMMDVPGRNKALPSPGPPPSYTSPNPNNYRSPQAGQYQAYDSQHQYISEPQELSVEPQSPASFFHKPVLSHERNLSELFGDTRMRSELETPVESSYSPSQLVAPMPQPQSGTYEQCQSPAGLQSEQKQTPHQSRQSQSQPDYSYQTSKGLGLQGGMEHSATRHADRGDDNVEKYHGA